jgi:putative transposase
LKAAAELAKHAGVKPACDALGVSRATFYRRQGPMTGHQQPRPTPARALSAEEQDSVFDVLCSERFVDRAPAEVFATLLDEGRYLCSERTMYRILASRAAQKERRPQLTHPEYTKPELMATGPNQVWSWDITRLLGPEKWIYFYLYVILDIFSRYVVGWMVANRENSTLAGRLIQQSCLKHGVQPQILTLHSDRGAPMTSQCTAQPLADLGVTRSLSRPQVSDDNPFSEAQFKTLKYHPSFPGRFQEQNQAKIFCRSFFRWYNTEHRHGGISMLTPEQVHFGQAGDIIARREAVLREAWTAHPERFVSGPPKPESLPKAVWINPPTPASLSPSTQEIAL